MQGFNVKECALSNCFCPVVLVGQWLRFLCYWSPLAMLFEVCCCAVGACCERKFTYTVFVFL